MKIVFLYTLTTNSVYAVLRSLAENSQNEIMVFYWNKGGNKPVSPPEISNVKFIGSSNLSNKDICDIVSKFSPSLIYVTAWQEKKYLPVVYKFKRNGIPVVAGFDDNWIGSLRQVAGSLLVSILGSLFFSHAMVSGPRQYYYAIKFGFKDSQILYYLFSADTNNFKANQDTLINPVISSNKTSFIFIGRYSDVKGISTLAKGFTIYKQQFRGRYNLICFGNGPQKKLLEGIEGVIVNDYGDMKTIINSANESLAFILPSNYDPSPLVVHEMALLGLPLLLSSNVGNRHMFLINNYNGLLFKAGDPNDLARSLIEFDALSVDEISQWGRNSILLSKQHNENFVGSSLISIIK
jgi:glycosyltransferase involved in cell wall biosynthesis